MTQDPRDADHLSPPSPLDYESPRDRVGTTVLERLAAMLTSLITIFICTPLAVSFAAGSVTMGIAFGALAIGVLVAWGLTAYRSQRWNGIAPSIFVGIGLGLLCEGMCFYTLSR